MTAFSISFAMFALRFLLYSIIRDPLWVLPVEMLNGITFGLSYIAGISYSAKIAPVGSEGTVQGLFAMAFQGFGLSLLYYFQVSNYLSNIIQCLPSAISKTFNFHIL